MLSNGPISFKVGIQGLTAQSTMEAELVASALTMKEAVFCSNMMLELGFKEGFGSVPLYIDNTSSVLHVVGNRTYNPRAKHIAMRYFFVQELVEEGKITINFVKKYNTESPISEPSTPTSTATVPSSSSLGNSRRKRQGDSVRRGRTRLYAGLEYFSILVGFGVAFSFSWTWRLHQRTVHHSRFLFSRVKGLVVFSGVFLCSFLHAIYIEGER